MEKTRCAWVTNDPIYVKYHDEEWGSFVNFTSDQYLFEMLVLESMQAGLNWLTILKRREHLRDAFDMFHPAIVAAYDEEKIAQLLKNEKIIRNRMKIEAAVNNAKAFLKVQDEFGSFHQFLWQFFAEKRQINHWKTLKEVPSKTEESLRLSKQLKKLGFTFVGPVICYSYMQAIGLVHDHTTDCFLHINHKEQ